MKKDDDEILDFVDALSVSLAEQVLEDDEALEKELRDMGQHRVEAMIERLRSLSLTCGGGRGGHASD